MTDGKMRIIIVNELERPCGLTLGLVKLMCWFTSQGCQYPIICFLLGFVLFLCSLPPCYLDVLPHPLPCHILWLYSFRCSIPQPSCFITAHLYCYMREKVTDYIYIQWLLQLRTHLFSYKLFFSLIVWQICSSL